MSNVIAFRDYSPRSPQPRLTDCQGERTKAPVVILPAVRIERHTVDLSLHDPLPPCDCAADYDPFIDPFFPSRA